MLESADQSFREEVSQSLPPEEIVRKTSKASLRDEAFNDIKSSQNPLSTEQIKSLRRDFNRTQRAASYTEDVPPKPTSSVVQVDIAPGSTPPVIRLGTGYISSVMFLDSTGAPWPIKSYNIGSPTSFNISWNQGSKENNYHMRNTLMIQSLTMYKQANLAVVLEGLNIPVMVTLIPGQPVVDYRVDLRVPGYGPNSRPEVNVLPSAESPDLIDILNSVPPDSMRRLQVSGAKAEAWQRGNSIFSGLNLGLLHPVGYQKFLDPMVLYTRTNYHTLQKSLVLMAVEW